MKWMWRAAQGSDIFSEALEETCKIIELFFLRRSIRRMTKDLLFNPISFLSKQVSEWRLFFVSIVFVYCWRVNYNTTCDGCVIMFIVCCNSVMCISKWKCVFQKWAAHSHPAVSPCVMQIHALLRAIKRRLLICDPLQRCEECVSAIQLYNYT